MADGGEDDGNMEGMEHIDDVRNRVHTEASILHRMFTKQGARMEEHGATGEKIPEKWEL